VRGRPTVDALMQSAGTAFVRGDAARAHELYVQVLAREPHRAEAYRGLGLALRRLERGPDAARAFERYHEQRPDAPDAARVRAQLDALRAPAEPVRLVMAR
jgi:regulator of sirC expression with transglutaminase-like and TPR domain